MTDFLALAESLKPALNVRPVAPVARISAHPDPAGFQGWAAEACPDLPLYPPVLKSGDTFILDFGQHCVGYLAFTLVHGHEGFAGGDSPVRLKLTFGETLAEVAEPLDPYTGRLARAWLQDEVFTFDLVPAAVHLPRRYAFRYLKVEVIGSARYAYSLREVVCHTVTSADDAHVPALPAGASPEVRALDEVSLRTLRNCMQTVFEDGPKRDRRLWLGDLRLEARLNYVTFRQNNLVKRCLYLFAGIREPDGLVNADMYETPTPMGFRRILDYSALFGPTVLDYVRATGDTAAGRDLWPVVKDQLSLLQFVNAEGLFIDPGNWWLFVDWRDGLHKQAAIHAILVYALRQTLALADLLGTRAEVADLETVIARMTAAGRREFYDASADAVRSGAQISHASLTWFTLADLLTKEEAARAFEAITANTAAIPPAGPYLYHHVVEAMLHCGRRAQAWQLVRTYWGGMLARSGSGGTFFEVWDPQNEKLSPYGSYHMNSYCHAWSCTAAWFIREHQLGIKP